MQRLEFQAQRVLVKPAKTACKLLLSYMHSKLFHISHLRRKKCEKSQK